MAENKSGYIHSKDICDMIKTHSYIPTYVRIKIADCCNPKLFWNCNSIETNTVGDS